jgi:oxygen-independent coproporphyrinogen-3 oxidase
VDHASIPLFLDCLEREIEMVGPMDLVFDTLYFGGGTPSVLEPKAIARIIDAAKRCFNIHADAELTLEANPGTVSRQSFARFRQAGVNRLNIGVQSFNRHNLEFLDRIHSADDALASIRQARLAGFENIGLDLIYGLPGQDKKNWLVDLNSALDADVTHLSCYILTCEDETPLGRDVNAGRINMPDEGVVRELFDTTIEFLTAHGFRQYEISNFARQPDDGTAAYDSRHNQKYWSFAPYIGLGPSAHSFVSPERRWNHKSIEKYVQQVKTGELPVAAKETLTREQMIMEAIYLGLRTTRGIDLDNFEKMFEIDFFNTFESMITDLKKEGFIFLTNTHFALSPRGLAYHDSIAAMLTSQDIDHI